jgi:hypothetical protein
MRYVLFPVVCLALVGCIHSPKGNLAASPGTPPPTPQQISLCESARTAHNVWTILGSVFGGVAGAQGAVDTVVTNKDAQIGIGIGVAASGIMSAVSATVASMKASDYATHNCDAVLSQANAGVVSPTRP